MASHETVKCRADTAHFLYFDLPFRIFEIGRNLNRVNNQMQVEGNLLVSDRLEWRRINVIGSRTHMPSSGIDLRVMHLKNK